MKGLTRLLLLSFALPSLAAAQTAGISASQALYEEGIAFLSAGRPVEAAESLDQSLRRADRPG